MIGFLKRLFNAGPKPYQDLDPQSFQQALKAQNGQLLDVRTPREVQQGAIRGAENINVMMPNFSQKVEHLDKNRPVFVYCQSGMRSGRACRILAELGYTPYNLRGGISAWTRAGL